MILIAIMLAAAHADQAIELTRPADIAAAASVDRVLKSLVNEAASCKSPGMTCACSLKPGLNRLSSAYHAAIKAHPNWKEAAVQYVVQANGRARTTAVMFPGIRRQLNMCHVP